MSRRSRNTLLIGTLVIVVTLATACVAFAAVGASGPADLSTQMQADRAGLAQTVLIAFLYLALIECVVTGTLAYHWLKPDRPVGSPAGEGAEGRKAAPYTLFPFTIATGLLALAVNGAAALLDVFVFDRYGGLNAFTLLCSGIPAGLAGALGGFLWGRVVRKANLTRIDLIPLIVIGVLAGILPGLCLRLLPQ